MLDLCNNYKAVFFVYKKSIYMYVVFKTPSQSRKQISQETYKSGNISSKYENLKLGFVHFFRFVP